MSKSSEETIFIFSYGSLMHPKDCERTIIPLSRHIGRVYGFKRYWADRDSELKTTFLSVKREGEHSCNGVFLEIKKTDVDALNLRECTSQLVELKLQEVECEEVLGKPAYIYMTDSFAQSDKEYPVLQSYIDVVLTAAFGLGDDFFKEFTNSTDWHIYVKNDRETPRYALTNPEFLSRVDEFLNHR